MTRSVAHSHPVGSVFTLPTFHHYLYPHSSIQGSPTSYPSAPPSPILTPPPPAASLVPTHSSLTHTHDSLKHTAEVCVMPNENLVTSPPSWLAGGKLLEELQRHLHVLQLQSARLIPAMLRRASPARLLPAVPPLRPHYPSGSHYSNY